MTTQVPLPRGYRGKKHETSGADLLALYRSLQLPEILLGAELANQLRDADPQGWYPIGTMLGALETVASSVGLPGLRKVGRTLVQLSIEPQLKKAPHTAKEILHSLDKLYRHNNRGEEIGGWKVLRFDAKQAEVEKTTPHHCAFEEGIVDAVLKVIGSPARLEQSACVRKGAPACRFLVTPVGDSVNWGA